MSMSTLLIYGLGVIAAGAVLFTLLPYLSGDIKAEKRKQALEVPRSRGASNRALDAVNRRKQVSESLKEVEKRGTIKRRTLDAKLAQAGLTLSKRTYVLLCITSALVFGLVLFVLQDSWIFAGAAALIGGFGLPAWILRFLGKRRTNKFVSEFPAAVDIIIRGVKAGLPLGDCLRVIASESPEPLRSEFRRVVEAQGVGLSIPEAVERMAERVPVTETDFFSVVIGIQAKAGGNLTEALGNLSRVIRERKKMKAKVKAVSAEANTSAIIIGSLPFIVGVLVYLTSPHYMEALWQTSTGRLVMGGCAIWMAIGIVVMKKMISFDI